ncbi:MAG: hypothetical protein KKB51_18955 [Candidatus Riflebacteria bacterium]|nr:hypothetical protein [Candidatus Riflebacteria bacterium]
MLVFKACFARLWLHLLRSGRLIAQISLPI